MILFYDTETTGLFDYRLPNDDPAQPHIVQLAATLHDEARNVAASFNFIIKPDGWQIPESMSAIHGITTAHALKYGLNAKPVLMLFYRLLENCSEAVAHNAPFDAQMIAIEFSRHGLVAPQRKSFCTMEAATPIVNLPPTEKMLAAGFNKPKSANLTECINFFFQEKLEGAHDALVDVNACARVYYHLKDREKNNAAG